MLRFPLPPPTAGADLRVLFLGAHSDDIEIGCGGTILRLAAERPGLSVHWVVLSATPERAGEARAAAAEFLAGFRNGAHVDVLSFQDGYFPSQHAEIKRRFEALKSIEPDLVVTHCRGDLHQDHRVANELTWNTFRDHAILEYEVPKYDADLGQPNVFMALDEATARRKVALLGKHFASQRAKPWFDEDLFLGLMRLRGSECRAPGRYAEAFYGRKVML